MALLFLAISQSSPISGQTKKVGKLVSTLRVQPISMRRDGWLQFEEKMQRKPGCSTACLVDLIGCHFREARTPQTTNALL